MRRFALFLDARTGEVRELGSEPFCVNPAEGVLWLDFESTDREDADWLAAHFQFHPLALEDCLKGGQRPKIDHYPTYAFLDLYEARLAPSRGEISLSEISLFLGDGYLVTAHKDPLVSLDEVRSRWQGPVAQEGGAGYLFYLLADTVVDAYFPLVDALEDLLEAREEELFGVFSERVITRIFHLKKQLVLFRKIVAPTRDVCLMLLRRESELIAPATVTYLQDVYDHLIRVADAIDTYRDLVSGSIDAYLSVVANRTNDTMKRLTSISAVLMSVTLVAGIYGMNFEHMPELHWTWGYEFAWGLMIAIAIALSLVFKALRYF